MNQQTILRIETNKIDKTVQFNGTFDYDVNSSIGLTVIGSGTTTNPYLITGTSLGTATFDVNNGQGTVYYNITGSTGVTSSIFIIYGGDLSKTYLVDEQINEFSGTINVNPGDDIRIDLVGDITYAQLYYDNSLITTYRQLNLDLYNDIPIKITKSFNELQDISKRNSDYSIGLLLPGSKINNEFFESFYDVNVGLLNFNPTKRVPCSILIDDAKYFTGFLKLNKVNVKDSKVEYDVTLYSNIGDIFGSIGNNLVKDLNFNDPYHKFNHTFNTTTVTNSWSNSNFTHSGEPYPYMYPIVHNGYEYSGDTINFSGGTLESQTRFFTSSSPIGSYDNVNDFYTAGGKKYRINSPTTGLVDNQLKPALSIWHLFNMIFKTYGYTLKSDFLNTPWFKNLYMYGYFNSDNSKFTYKTESNGDPLLPSEIEFIVVHKNQTEYFDACANTYENYYHTFEVWLVKKGTGIPVTTTEDITIPFLFDFVDCTYNHHFYTENITIPFGQTSGYTQYYASKFVACGYPCNYYQEYIIYNGVSSSSPIKESSFPLTIVDQTGDPIAITDGTYINFNNVIDENLKQIDLISSIAKKFDLIFTPNPENPKEIIVEPYVFYVGTGNIYDWTNKLSYDKGFSIEPAINYIESVLNLTDLEDGDAGNIEFKNRNNRIYGQNIVNNITDFKSDEKKIETIFSPMIVRKWDADGEDNVGLPLGISYSSNNKEIDEGDSKRIFYYYSGVKTKPKLFYWLGSFNPFIDTYQEIFDYTKTYKSYQFHIRESSTTTEVDFDTIPVISHSMSIGNRNSIDSLSILFNSEIPTYIDVETFNTYTSNDIYEVFYKNRIDNLYNPNTRFITGYFNLSLPDISNLKPNDIIKIGEKYFTWNKISDYDYTNKELTKIELIQFNNSYKEYPTRYFKYYYCDAPENTYKIKTDFTNDSLLGTNYFWSLQYDYNIGQMTGTTTGYTSSFFHSDEYYPYYIYETTESDYNLSGITFDYDPLVKGGTGYTTTEFYNLVPTYWKGTTMTGVNLFTDCADFNTKATTYSIPVGTPSSPLPTPTPTPTPTPIPTPTIEPMSGSLLININM